MTSLKRGTDSSARAIRIGRQTTLEWGSGRLPVAVRPLAPYLGGKRNLAASIDVRIQATEHMAYAEPFFGMGGVFFRRSRAARTEVINDISREIVTLLRVVQRHHEALCDLIRFQVASRSEFERMLNLDSASLTDLERAARFLFLQRTGFGGKICGRTFGVSKSASSRFNSLNVRATIEAVHERLSGVVIECLSWQEFIERYDHRGMLFYLDPPYWGSEACYGHDIFDRADFAVLASTLRKLKGKFILSINDLPDVRDLFDWARFEEVRTTYSISADGRRRSARELIIYATT